MSLDICQLLRKKYDPKDRQILLVWWSGGLFSLYNAFKRGRPELLGFGMASPFPSCCEAAAPLASTWNGPVTSATRTHVPEQSFLRGPQAILRLQPYFWPLGGSPARRCSVGLFCSG